MTKVDGSLTSASYGTPTNTTAGETCMEVDTSATAISGGELIYEGLVNTSGAGGTASGGIDINSLLLDIPADKPVSLCVRRIAGTNATVSAVVRWTEEW